MLSLVSLFLLASLIIGAAFGAPAVAGIAEIDTRLVPWTTVRRLALSAGRFTPAVRPVSGAELADLLRAVARETEDSWPESDSKLTATTDAAEKSVDLLEWRQLRDLSRYLSGPAGHRVWPGDSGGAVGLALVANGRLQVGFSDLGQPRDGEAGLAWGPGWNTTFESGLTLAAGRWWLAATPRLTRRWAGGSDPSNGAGPDDPLDWPGWSPPTGRSQVRLARYTGDDTRLDVPRALAGVRLGNWSLSLGWDARRTGPGLTGALLLDHTGASFPALTARRVRPFTWHGIMSPVAPSELLLRAGLLSQRTVFFSDDTASFTKSTRPWFFQWLTGWQPTGWSRIVISHAVMASARDGTLWPDLLQLNLPMVGTTWREMDSGPATDRVFAVQLELRWRQAPWPLLPGDAGRLFWDYAGTDFLPSGPGGVIPQISVPASVVGAELVSKTWDLAAEYAELQHDNVLWYSNSGFPEGYTQRGWLLGHPLGGSAEAWTGKVRVRPGRRYWQWQLLASRATWGMREHTPGTARETRFELSLAPTLGSAAATPIWCLTAAWRRTVAEPLAYDGGSDVTRRNWWQAWFEVRF